MLVGSAFRKAAIATHFGSFRRTLIRSMAYISCLCLIADTTAGAQSTSDSIAAATVSRRAIEAVIWAMPAVNFERMMQATLDIGAKPNQIVYWSKPVNWKNQTLTPNPDTIYFMPFYDTTSGPVVLEVPASEGNSSVTGSIDDAWQEALEDVGTAGADKGKGGKFLITPPGYQNTPPSGYIVLPSKTFRGFALIRSNYANATTEDISRAVEYGKQMKFYPLENPGQETVYVDAFDKMFDATIPYDATYFDSLNHFVQIEPWLTRDKVMIDILESIGIKKGKEFKPVDTTSSLLAHATSQARAEINANYESLFKPPFYEGTGWAVPASKEVIEGSGNGFANPEKYPVSSRATTFAMGYFSAKHLGSGQFYLMTARDKTGQPLRGNKNYKLTVPANAPVSLYWSATAYDRETHALIRDTPRSSLGSNTNGIETNPRGDVDIYFGPMPASGNEKNWVPTGGRDFEVLFRLYGPQKTFFDKTWVLPNLEVVN